ncbi:hypothetical protein BJ912DRAFT_944615 [Pholiota molesta]|nr:hypothetical protein BJ912DRAFT_944615 [Pholiota molesta]
MQQASSIAPHPFDNSAADVILRSSDKEPTDFRAFKLLLSLASPFFSEIFTLLSRRIQTHPSTPMKDKQTLQLLLGLCLPIIQEAAFKFEMEGIQKYLRAELVLPRFIESQPLRVFAIAYRYGWDLEARKAARYTLRHPITNIAFVSELEFISGATFYRLQEYHRMCGEVASSRALLQPALAEQHDIWTWITCKRCPAVWNANSLSNTNYPPARKWWTQWIEDIAEELRIKPWGETVRKWDILKKAQAQAAGCPNCGKRAAEDLEAFSLMLAVEIERDISMVDLDLNLDDWSSASTID